MMKKAKVKNSDGVPLFATEDVDFRNLPDEELYPCCLWEYARESRKVRGMAQLINDEGASTSQPMTLHIVEKTIRARDRALETARKIQTVESQEEADKLIAVGKSLNEHQKYIARAAELLKEPLFRYTNQVDSDFNKITMALEGVACGLEAGFAFSPEILGEKMAEIAWDLHKAIERKPNISRLIWKGLLNSRSEIVYLALEKHLADGNPTFPSPWKSLSREKRDGLSRHWPLVASTKSAKGAKVLAPRNPISEGAFVPHIKSEGDGDDAANKLVDFDLHVDRFQIKWGFTDQDILVAVQDWLKKNRPATSTPDDRRGQNLDHFRVALRRLGRMRRIFSNQNEGNAEERKDARRALEHFQEFVKAGFLCDANIPGDCSTEYPIHWPVCFGSPTEA